MAAAARPARQVARYEEVSRTLLGKHGVRRGEGRGFGTGALAVNGRIFAMLSSRGEFVVKFPRDRVDALVASRAGTPFDAGRGRLMREWLALGVGSRQDWTPRKPASSCERPSRRLGLEISINTVGNIAAKAYKKLGVHGAAAAVHAHRDAHFLSGSTSLFTAVYL